ncbi:unnamed protein product, partial [Vitis vinifera]
MARIFHCFLWVSSRYLPFFFPLTCSSSLWPDFQNLNSISCLVALCYANIERQQATSPSVIVKGAGMAGSAAARALHDASFRIINFFIFQWDEISKYN